MLGLLIGFCAVLGLAVGSFLNVVIYRVPRGESIITPRSSCPACGAEIQERDNIPVVSWLVLHGRCRDCDASISMRYPLVELSCAALFAGTAARFGRQWDLPAFLALFAGLLALSCIDVERMILPKKIVYPLTVLVASPPVCCGGGDRHMAYALDRCHLRRGVVRSLSRHEPRESPDIGFRGRATFVCPRALSRVVGRQLRPAGILCSEPHRRHGRHRSDCDQTHGSADPSSLRGFPGRGMRRGRVRGTGDSSALHPLHNLRASDPRSKGMRPGGSARL